MDQVDLSPPPTPGPSSFAPRPMHAIRISRAPSRSLSLRIPEDGQAFGGLTQPSLPSPALQLDTSHAGPSTLSQPPQSRLARKRPSKLNLAPPSLSDESGQSSRSMPNSPVAPSRSETTTSEQTDNSAPPASAISEAVKNLSSTLRGTPRRRPSMPFKNTAAAAAQSSAYPEPPSAASSRSRPPEAFRDPSEHILSGKGSTLQHARSVYSHGPVEILPGLFLGDEHNARDARTLSSLGIITILNVAKETVLDFPSEQPPAYASTPQTPWSSVTSSIGNPGHGHTFVSSSRPQYGSRHASAASEQVPSTPSTYFTPPTTASISTFSGHGESSSPRDAISASVLRNTSSTPNLLAQFLENDPSSSSASVHLHSAAADPTSTSDLCTLTAEDVLQYRTLRRTSDSSSDDDAFGTASSPSSSHAPSTCTSATTELTPPALMSFKSREDAGSRANASSGGFASQQPSPNHSFFDDSQVSTRSWITQVELPSKATATMVSAIPEHGRSYEMRYIKLPWTHDETELASGHGGFAHGCALIAEALGIDRRYWYAAKIAADPDACAALQDDSSLEHVQTSSSPGKILVHCQCGVSRSATLVIAFVMQAAAMRYGFTSARSLLGMHDCYNMVKEKSSSISPNISLIYQLVEWERYLSSAAGRLRDMLGMGRIAPDGEAGAYSGADGSSGLAGAGWSTEPMDEAMWSKMRLEEEEKEAAEETRRREERLNEAIRLAAERKATQDRLEGRDSEIAIGGDAGAGSLMQRRRKKAAPALQLQPAASSAGLAPTAAAAPVPSPGLNRRRPPALRLNSASSGYGDEPKSRADADGDVLMNELDPPQTPLRSSAADSDVVSTPTARTTAATFGPDSASSMLRTPVAWSSSSTPAGGASEITGQPLSASLQPTITTTEHSLPTTMLSPASPAMLSSRSAESQPNRFSFGGAPMSGSLSARLEAPDSRSRPVSVQSAMSSSSSSTALFGVTALSREERKKQHRRTFSSDWPTLQANLASQHRRKSKVDAGLPSPAVQDNSTATSSSGPGPADMDL